MAALRRLAPFGFGRREAIGGANGICSRDASGPRPQAAGAPPQLFPTRDTSRRGPRAGCRDRM